MVRVLPVSQKKLTNVSIVKYKCKKKTFELACYRNKVIAWRMGNEKNMADVLQIDSVFSNVETGHEASKDDLKLCFPGFSYEDVVRCILDKGDMQVTDDEREMLQDNLLKQIAGFIAERVVDPLTGKPIAQELIIYELKGCGFATNWNAEVKPEGLRALSVLENISGDKLRRAWYRIQLEADDLIAAQKILDEYEHVLVSENPFTFDIHPKYFGQLSRSINDKCTSTIRVVNNLINPAPYCSNIIKNKESNKNIPIEKPSEIAPKTPSLPTTNVMICSTCLNIPFGNAVDYRKHVKSDWHIFNTKRKARGLESIDFELYDMLEENEGYTASDNLR